MDRRKFIRLAGGGTLLAASSSMLPACSSAFPDKALEAWQGPGPETDPRRWALSHAITAPNPHNLQPWMADLREPGAIVLRTDRQRLLPETDPFGRQILIGHGAMLELLVMALAEQGFDSEVTLWPAGELGSDLKTWDDRPVARVVLKPGAKTDPLFAQILKRHTPKVDFDTQAPVALHTLDNLLATARAAGHGLNAGGTVDPARLEALRNLCWQSAQVELTTARTVMESIRLTRVGPTEILEHRDGISINSLAVRTLDALGMFDRSQPPAPGSDAYKAMMSRFDGHSRTAMGFIWLSGENTRGAQIAAGRTYVRLQLKATELGIGVHPMSQAIQEFAEMAPHYANAHKLLLGKPSPANASDETVQMFCRLGYAPKPWSATPRRPLSAFLRT